MPPRRGMPLLSAGVIAAWIIAGGGVAQVSTVPATSAIDDSKVVKVRDSCTPSFNIFFGDPTICQQSDGKVDVLDFLDYLGKHLSHPLWQFELWHQLLGGRCPSLADSVRGPEGHRAATAAGKC